MSLFSTQKRGSVYVGLSGGVDSAVSAALLKREGYDVTGVFIKIQVPEYPCPATEDRRDAMRTAAHTGIHFIEIDLSREYAQRVLEVSLREFQRGRTPNPDTLCNREIKFGLFADFAFSQGADFIATGHYARTRDGMLFSGADERKDQSYFLWAAPNAALRKTLFPVGDMHKPEVRALAQRLGLPNAMRPDSQGLCFLGDLSLEALLRKETAPVQGSVLDEDGRVVGVHEGVQLYTLGQRHGFTLHARSSSTPMHYVVAKDTQRNTLTVSAEKYPRNAQETLVELKETNWLGSVQPGIYKARYRYRQKLLPARLESQGAASALVRLLEPHYVPLGQSLVLYDGTRCLGGGVADSAQLVHKA